MKGDDIISIIICIYYILKITLFTVFISLFHFDANCDKSKMKTLLKVSLCGAVVGFIVDLLLLSKNIPIIFIIIVVLTLIPIAIKIGLDVNIFYAAAISWMCAICKGMSDILSEAIIRNIYHIKTESIVYNLRYALSEDIIPFCFLFIVIQLLKKNKKGYRLYLIQKCKKYEESFMYIIFFGVAVLILSYQIKFSCIRCRTEDIISEILAIILIFSCFNIYFKKIKLDIENKYLKKMMISTEGAFIIYKKLKHNYVNSISSIKSFSDKNEYKKLELYLNELLEYTEYVNQLNFLDINKIKNYALYGLLGSKIPVASERQIKFKMRVYSEIKEINMKTSDMVEVIGNMLDNALEASEESINRIVCIEIIEEDEFVSISISNTFDNEIDLSKIKEKGVSSKGINRGYGLWICENILKRYDNILHNTEIEKKNYKFFKQEIVVYK